VAQAANYLAKVTDTLGMFVAKKTGAQDQSEHGPFVRPQFSTRSLARRWFVVPVSAWFACQHSAVACPNMAAQLLAGCVSFIRINVDDGVFVRIS